MSGNKQLPNKKRRQHTARPPPHTLKSPLIVPIPLSQHYHRQEQRGSPPLPLSQSAPCPYWRANEKERREVVARRGRSPKRWWLTSRATRTQLLPPPLGDNNQLPYRRQ